MKMVGIPNQPSQNFTDQTIIVHDFPRGTPRLAAFIDSSDHNAVFRRFGRMSARLLTELEIELTDLQKELDDLDKKDSLDSSMEPRLRGCVDFDANDGAQKEILECMQKKIREYCEEQSYLYLRIAS